MTGKTISHFTIIEKLGEGGMGIVYKAEDTRLHRTVALKFLPSKVAEYPEVKARFFQEAQAASALDHPNIATVYEIDEADGQWFIAMAYVEGQNLREKIRSGTLHTEEVLDLTLQIAEGLSAAHAKGIVHRDIKSTNILITSTGQVKITDFGLAKYKDSSLLTREGTVMGTPAYMSPEQAQCEEVDNRSDIFSLGIVLYEMLTNQLPFCGDNDPAILYSIVHQKQPQIRTIAPHVPPGLEKITSKSLEKDKRKRYRHMDEMLTDLYIVRDELKTAGVKPSLKKVDEVSRKKRLKSIAIPFGIMLILSLAILVLRPRLFEQVLISEPTPVTVISFENRTGNKAHDYLQHALPNLLITSLEQSKYLRVTTWERLYDLLIQLGKEEVEIIDKDLGLELGRMDGSLAIVLGSFEKKGDTFNTDVTVLNIETERIIRSVSLQWKGNTDIENIPVDEMSREISRSIGITERQITKTQRPIADVTTTSMEAYNYFLRGRDDFEKCYFEDSRQFLERAVTLDSTFAVAHLYLARVLNALGNSEARDKAYESAIMLARKATEKERLYIEAAYADFIEKNKEKTFHILKRMSQKYRNEKRVHHALAIHYFEKRMFSEAIEEFRGALELDPNYGLALNNLAFIYSHMGEYQKAIETMQRYASVSPGDANPFDSMAEIYLKMGLLDEAIAKYKEALDVKPDFGAEWKIGYICALQENYVETMKWIDRYIRKAPSPGRKAEGYLWNGFYHFWLGNIDQASIHLERARDLGTTVGNELIIAYTDWTKGWIHCENEEFNQSRDFFRSWFDAIKETPPPYIPSPAIPFYSATYNLDIGLVDVKANQIDSAKTRAVEVESLLQQIDPAVRDGIAFNLDLLCSEILCSEGSNEKAISVSQTLEPLGLPYMYTEIILRYNEPFLRDIVARIYQQKGDLDKAVTEYERLITFDPGGIDRRLVHPKYHYRLAKLYEQKNISQKAAEQFRTFLEIWKDADEDVPELIDAKARLAKLADGK